jgi:hypothetical protein
MAVPLGYDVLTCVLPLLWVAAVGLAGGYDSRFIGLGSDEFRKVLNAAVGLTVALRRLAVEPGITGLWQVSGRSDLPWHEAMRLDIRYVENWSFALGLQILRKTLSAVLKGSGAY